MRKLFLAYLGGRALKSNIEVHDVQFVVGDTIEETFDTLRENWFGIVKGLHLDTYTEVQRVDGFRVQLRREPAEHSERLFFVNFGGYDPSSLAELHQFGMFVARSEIDAKARAKASLLTGSRQPHKDDLFDVDDCFAVDGVGDHFIHLVPGEDEGPLTPDWFGYRVIG